ncbi:hypothetical protein G6701_01270 [Polynucleobacter paneuropaeus]|nr:hypothetical protein [Polynucleobacter paneuropaeus]
MESDDGKHCDSAQSVDIGPIFQGRVAHTEIQSQTPFGGAPHKGASLLWGRQLPPLGSLFRVVKWFVDRATASMSDKRTILLRSSTSGKLLYACRILAPETYNATWPSHILPLLKTQC